MTVNYNKLWKKLIDLEISRTEMRLKAGISTKQLAKLGKNENVNTEVLVKICQALHCNIDEIIDLAFLFLKNVIANLCTSSCIFIKNKNNLLDLSKYIFL